MFAWSFPPWNQTDHSFVNSKFDNKIRTKNAYWTTFSIKESHMNLKCSSHIITSAKLAIWLKQVNVVGAHIVFCHSNDGTRKTLLTMMISWMLRHITRKLGNFCFLNKVPLERVEKNFPLFKLSTRLYFMSFPIWSSWVLGCTCRRCYIRYIFVHFL